MLRPPRGPPLLRSLMDGVMKLRLMMWYLLWKLHEMSSDVRSPRDLDLQGLEAMGGRGASGPG